MTNELTPPSRGLTIREGRVRTGVGHGSCGPRRRPGPSSAYPSGALLMASEPGHGSITSVLVEMTAYNVMRLLHELQAERARAAFGRA